MDVGGGCCWLTQHRGNDNTSLVPALKFEAGKVSAIGGHRSVYEKGYPKLVLVEKRRACLKGESEWRAACVSSSA
jgi:hypothetical protein